ncbi:hypothetical protein BD324DRAFT_651995 [Kockovaella imperatae]|uniref:Zn(2)-C6 fungal-type domain-containing protein n=1 Tax=Kockovaella imperatae TaxID=4999 RepID=A0A1Y1UDH9_9TREE|nr:hypothetical protein BD324DRAFT_651995 [Kockovaella imperatae]ORX36091.1 hypothetical protein BD324DRAFT_651995 [Kockovaella imperatae]
MDSQDLPPDSPGTSSDGEAVAFDGVEAKTNVLARNLACHQCRKRKMKCDGVRPTCANCQKPRARLMPGHPPIPCTWDSEEQIKQKKKKGSAKDEQGTGKGISKRARINQLEERLAKFEKMFPNSNLNDPTQILVNSGPSTGTGLGPLSSGSLYVTEDPFASWAPNDPLGEWARGANPYAGLHPDASSQPNQGFNAFPAPGFTGELSWPDWPRDLPSLDVVEHCVATFFDKIPLLPLMIHRPSFMTKLQLPPSHPEFPPQALIHAMLAMASAYIPESSLAKRAYYPTGTPWFTNKHPEVDLEEDPELVRTFQQQIQFSSSNAYSNQDTAQGRFKSWHRRKTFVFLQKQLTTGKRLVQAVQAQVIVATMSQYTGLWVDAWFEIGIAMRMIPPMRLSRRPDVKDAYHRWGHSIMPLATDEMDQAERDRTFWVTYCLDCSTAHMTGSAESIAPAEITVDLPVTQALYDRASGGLIGIQSLHSPEVITHHPPEHCDSFSFFVKAMYLFSEVHRFFRVYGGEGHSIPRFLNHPLLRKCVSDINAFRNSIPFHLRRPTRTSRNGESQAPAAFDTLMLATNMVINSAVMALGEPLMTPENWNSEFAKLALASVRSNLSLLYDINATSYDLTLLPTPCAFSFTLSCRALSRFIQAATQSGDKISAMIFRTECEVFRHALLQYGERWILADRLLAMVDVVLDSQGMSASAEFADGISCRHEVAFDPAMQESVRNESSWGTRIRNSSAVSSISSATTPASSTGVGPAIKDVAPGVLSVNVSPVAKSNRPPQDAYGHLQHASISSDLGNIGLQQPNSTLDNSLSAPVEWPQGSNPATLAGSIPQVVDPIHLATASSYAEPPVRRMSRMDLGPNFIPAAVQGFQGTEMLTGDSETNISSLSSHLGVNIGDWLDIQNYAFDVDSLAQNFQSPGGSSWA